MLPGLEMLACTDMAVPMEVMRHVVRVESSFNPYAIGVVGGRLVRQPRNLSEAVSTVRMLEREGYNFSLGIAQVNRYNLANYGLASYERAFEVCPNLQAGARILAECHQRAGGDWGKAFSCYYSGNFSTGFRHGYVQKVFASWQQAAGAQPGVGAIALASEAPVTQRRRMASTAASLDSLVARRILDATREEPETRAIQAPESLPAHAQAQGQLSAHARPQAHGGATHAQQALSQVQRPTQPAPGPANAAAARPVLLQPHGAPPLQDAVVQSTAANAMPVASAAMADAQSAAAAPASTQAIGASPPMAAGKDEAFVF